LLRFRCRLPVLGEQFSDAAFLRHNGCCVPKITRMGAPKSGPGTSVNGRISAHDSALAENRTPGEGIDRIMGVGVDCCPRNNIRACRHSARQAAALTFLLVRTLP
jgi:hypothetical protein